MPRSASSPHRLRAPFRAAACVAMALGWGTIVSAATPAHRPPLYARMAHSLFPGDDPGYLPMAGSPPLRIGTAAAPVPIAPPPIVLYAPPEPGSANAAPLSNVVPVAPPIAAEEMRPPSTSDRKPPPVRPEDFLPYFQLNDGTGRSGPAEGFQFMPARPDLPSSQASYQQQ